MNISGIIVEYNPLHNGHVYHINKTKELTNCDALICVMSGNFTQRGIPSSIDKWTKTKMALNNGVDLVIELPTIYSVSSADFFSFGAVSLLNSLGVVDNICFGSEHGNINDLYNISNILLQEPIEFKSLLKTYLSKGITYPLARSNALYDYLMNSKLDISDLLLDNCLNSPNNILGIEYCKSLIKLKSSITPYTLKREGASYNSDLLHNEFSSATAIRKFLKENGSLIKLAGHIPSSVLTELQNLYSKNYEFTFEDSMFPYIKHKSATSKNSLVNLPDVSEGLDNRIISSLQNSLSYSSALANIKSKRYTYTRISRILCQYFIGFDSFDTKKLRSMPCPYARILGFNSNGKSILKSIKSNSSIPLYTKIPKKCNDTMQLDTQSTRAYSIINSSISHNSDYLISPIIIK
ncbi:nucleotidyltransferase [Clostridium sp. CM028]|uniref:nucleotidyltransferase n=1 Tax=unclassified Clostridium TaxID=2614128 RepID=UPI001C0C83D5|nr:MULTISPECIES: nucleotidyltransferase [unclassified Clostridium]MBU3091612.1 nucleotidyltransferase [Clostridium sp. CF011]MBW9144123.1 nucleotidyltransferase [Clostridium sp. CM027]MBW9147566.1 nucleotidyltransferase [Clostridium sp. CM028]UVE41234.1 nucleotidyltransferase [Clostridium sp. CM027]WAG70230.1 nucleotidyltransferase [Clostridium sp. CF011]